VRKEILRKKYILNLGVIIKEVIRQKQGKW